MEQQTYSQFLALIPLVLIILGLAVSVCLDSYLSAKNRRIMLIIVALIFSLVLQNTAEYMLEQNGMHRIARTLVAIYGYSVRPVILLMFFYIVAPRQKCWPFWIAAGANALIHLTALFSGICFYIDANNGFSRGPLGYTSFVVSGYFLFCLVCFTAREFWRSRKTETLIPILNAVLIVFAILCDTILVEFESTPTSFLTIAAVCCTLFYYIWLHLQFVREHGRALQAEQRIQIMMTQIQPHFLYNTLTTIQSLCRLDPEKAAYVTERFGAYLRQNIDSLSRTDLIPLEKELEHTRIYAEIELVRFPQIQMEYDIQDAAFRIPALTIQPLLENAIRHGVRIRKDGRVTVRTRREGAEHVIEIEDNGKGFDVQTAEETDETHIGIRNVRERIERMCLGRLTIDSRIGEGTTVMILIPEQANQGVGKA